ncbi:DNA polymerase IV [Parvularcula dongshanensis]|uniref:DNA polymerase IV n=1 Tax=Parvularcula dongshanensis TaxID=1173995 RepID=A0A840I3F7_9PROT|nr:DNA polymerase IV [Parvularcula dongshanensis]MBB4659389.1 DNA polymerase-4 [Parvularcula dongshanensis]
MDRDLGICRDCDWFGEASPRCPQCDSVRVLKHDELGTLGIAHLDCDAFFAAIEKRDDPDLADKPVVIGGGRRGVVSTACYVARTYGVRSAMPMFQALRLCPDATIVRPRFEAYREAAHQIRQLMTALTPLIQPVSIDEAYLDLRGTARLHGRPPAASLARLVRKISDEVGIDVSIGLSHNKFLAKTASDLDKPRGFAIIGKAETEDFLRGQPPSFVRGVGTSFAGKLERDGFRTLADVQAAGPRAMADRYGEAGLRLYRLSFGRDDRPVTPERETKSISSETTFGEDVGDRDALEDRLYAMAQKTARRAKEKGFAGRVVTLKLKTSDFKLLTRRRTLGVHTNLARVLYDEGVSLLREEVPSRASRRTFRLIGLGLSDLTLAEAMTRDFAYPEAHRKIGSQEAALDALRARFGDEAIGTLRDARLRKPRSPS